MPERAHLVRRVTDTLTKCLTEGRGVLHCIAHRR
jgi:hypothetical protein